MEHPPYEVTNHQQARTWSKWTSEASDEQLLEALHGCASWESVPAVECRDELQQRGYVLVGSTPHEVVLEIQDQEGRDVNP